MGDEPGSAASILIVDDTAENLRLLTGMLGEQGFDVRPVTSGLQALRAAELEPPDLILLDITMPEMDGYQVCAKLKESSTLGDVPVIFLTALGDTADKVKAFAAGGVDYITKPFQFEEVLARSKAQIYLRRTRQELAHQYERLRRLEQLRDDLVKMVVHDMRTPLTVLLANLGFLREQTAAALGRDAADDLQAATTAAQSLCTMANDLLDISRLEDGKMPLTHESFDLVDVAKRVLASLAILDPARRLRLNAPTSFQHVADQAVIQRVLENLVSNAIKHTPTGGTVELAVLVTPQRTRVEVRDQGPGVPHEARHEIFEKFGTITARTQRKYHSAGLGLAFCKLAVLAHGGTIGVQDGAAGGSVFWFELPR